MAVDVVPSMAPVDHTFRFYEPEESFFAVRLPALVSLDKSTLNVSSAQITAEIDNQGTILVKGRTGEAMSNQSATLFIYNGSGKPL